MKEENEKMEEEIGKLIRHKALCRELGEQMEHQFALQNAIWILRQFEDEELRKTIESACRHVTESIQELYRRCKECAPFVEPVDTHGCEDEHILRLRLIEEARIIMLKAKFALYELGVDKLHVRFGNIDEILAREEKDAKENYERHCEGKEEVR